LENETPFLIGEVGFVIFGLSLIQNQLQAHRSLPLENEFTHFFGHALGPEFSPYPYQVRLASGPWPDVLKIETGMGKTASIILSWLFRRLRNDSGTPRRLVYCLPMRVLVEQTARNARQWIRHLSESAIIPPEFQPEVYVLMGGELDKDWDRFPEKDAILVGTQDQLLSRALNRGYAMSRFRWPVHFGLLNNDCLWVMDEIQLMGSGLATTAQLQAFRESMGTTFPVRSIWMSATLQKDWLKTVDFLKRSESLAEMRLSDEDKNYPEVKRRLEAHKAIKKADIQAEKPQKVAEMLLDIHQRGTRTLVVLNTVNRAVEIYKALKQRKGKADLTLVHSRFRPGDREQAIQKLLAPPVDNGSICVSTQVIEAGVDVSSHLLVTDLAPWPSLVQRFGRCNRDGLDNKAQIHWLDIDLNKKGAELPYGTEELNQAFNELSKLKDAGPGNLPDIKTEAKVGHVLRRKDLIDVFDTTPDLAGLDVDISRYIRETADHDLQVFWREFPEGGPTEEEPAPVRDELCSVPVYDLKAAEGIEKWRWDHLERRWIRSASLSPGMLIILRSTDGGYSPELGWTGKPTDIPHPIETKEEPEEGNDDDLYSARKWQILSEHTNEVVKELKALLVKCQLSDQKLGNILLLAARWHDAGKAHEVFQAAALGKPPEADPSLIWGKTGRGGIFYARKGFRHELASALAILQNGLPDLVAYLAAAHHGKIRLSIRSLPIETPPGNPDLRFARGIWEGDVLPQTELGDDHRLPETILDLSFMDFGNGPRGPSWLARILSLRDDIAVGPFRIAYLESLLRAADWRASQKKDEGND
jgi:CRISPR-associated endonuclease/helicase Cas3